MQVFKWVLVIAIVCFAIWQIILLAKQIVEREKNKKLKSEQKQDETKATATIIVDNKEDN